MQNISGAGDRIVTITRNKQQFLPMFALFAIRQSMTRVMADMAVSTNIKLSMKSIKIIHFGSIFFNFKS